MNIEKVTKKIITKYDRVKDQDIERLARITADFKLPFDIVCGIYLIETTFRPLHYRLVEYTVVFFKLLLSVIGGLPIKNYTVGKCQIGLGTILCFYGYTNATFHSKEICNINFDQAISIIRAFFDEYNLLIFVWRLRFIYASYTEDIDNIIINIGYGYNGNMIYGLVLERVINELRLSDKLSPQVRSEFLSYPINGQATNSLLRR